MARLSEEIPAWVGRYVPLRYDELGAPCRGLGCWALVRKVYAEQYGVYLPTLSDHFAGIDDAPGLRRALEAERGPGGSGWAAVPAGLPAARQGDVAVFRIAGELPHVGVVVARDRVLHALPGCESCVERIDTVVWRRRLVEVLRLEHAPVRVVGRVPPYTGEGTRIDTSSPAGLTVEQILASAGVEPLPGLRVYVGDQEVPRWAWARVRPRPGRIVTVAVTPAGGKDALRIVATIAIIAAAAFAPAVFMGGKAAVAAAVAAGSATPAIISGSVAIAGGLLLNAIAPPPKPKLSAGDATASPTIAGSRNEARPYGVIPQVLGYHRLAPPFAALPYTEISGDQQYLRMLFAWYGPCEISDIKIGDTPIQEYEGVEIEVRGGFETDEPVTIYPGTVNQQDLSVLLEQAAGWTVRTTSASTEEISVDVAFPAGLVELDAEGERLSRTVGVEVEYAPAGSGQWVKVNGDAGATGSPEDAGQMRMLFRTPEVTLGGVVQHEGAVSWGAGFADPKPAYLPETGYSWTAQGWLHVTSPGQYTFSVDASDAADLEVDGRIVASFYGTHTAAGSFDGQAGAAVTLSRGYHQIRIRMEARSTAGAVAIAWRRGSDPFEVIPAAALRLTPLSGSPQGLQAAWYLANGYTSTIATTAAQTTPLRRTLSWAVPRGQYDVRLRRTTMDTPEERVIDDVYWTALRSINADDPVRFAPAAKIAVRIRATDQLSGVIEDLNCMVRSIVTDWDADAGEWVTRASNNPASLYRWILQGPANARPVADERLDLAELASWHEACAADGWTFNAVLDFPGTVYERLADVAAAGRASFGMRDGLFSIVRDRRQTAPVQMFTPRNSRGFSAELVFPDIPHALRVQFLDETSGYARAERIVLADGYQLDGKDAFGQSAPELPEATEFATLELFGITDPEAAWAHGRYHLAVLQLRPEVVTLSTDFEHLACSRGNLVLVTHDVAQWGLAFGRVARLQLDEGGNLVGFDLDDEVTMDAGDEYRIVVRLGDGEIWVRPVVTVEGVHRRVSLANPVSPGAKWPAVGDLYGFGRPGEETRELIVTSIEPDEDLGATLTLVDHAPAVHEADEGVIPPWDPGISRPPAYQDGPEVPTILYLQSDDWVMVRGPDGVLRPRLLVAIGPPGGTRPLPSHYQVRIRPRPPAPAEPVGPWTSFPLFPYDNPYLYLEGVEVGVTYQVRVRAVTAAGRASAWAEAEHTVVGAVLPPPDVQSFDVVRLADGTRRYSWVLGPVPPDIVGVIIRYGPSNTSPSWEQMTAVHTGHLDPASPQELNEPGAGSWRFGIKMVDASGNESRNMRTVDRVLGRPRRPDSIATVDARIEGWPGTKTSCFVSHPGPMLEAVDAATWDSLPTVQLVTTWDAWSRWNLEPAHQIRYEHPAIDLGAVVSSSPAVSVVADGSAVVEVRHSEDGSTWSDWTEYSAVEGTSVVARYHQWRVTVTRTGAAPVAALRELVMDALARPEEQFLDNIETAALPAAYRLGVGDVRLPIDATRFQVIRSVNLTFNGVGAGWSYVIVDKDHTVGPRVRLFGPSGQPGDATVDATVRGF